MYLCFENKTLYTPYVVIIQCVHVRSENNNNIYKYICNSFRENIETEYQGINMVKVRTCLEKLDLNFHLFVPLS